MNNKAEYKKDEKSAYLGWRGQWKLVGDIYSGEYPKDKKLRCIEKALMMFFVFVRTFSLSNFHVIAKTDNGKARFIDVYVIVEMVVLVVLLMSYPIGGYAGVVETWVVVGVIWYIIVQTFNYVLCVVFVDMHEKKWLPRSYSGSMIMLFMNYLQLVVGFGVLYLYYGCIGYSDCGERITRANEAFYYSTVTITTLGYGDMEPLSQTGRILSSVETLMGIVLLVLVLNAILRGQWLKK